MRQAEDAMAFGNVDRLQVIGNAVNGMKTPVEQHHDMIQITPNGGMSSNVVIRGNVLDSNDLITHGIFFGSGSAAYRNVTIENNMVIGGHQHGITVGRTDGLTVAGNTVLRDAESTSTRPIDTPVINVGAGSSGAQITGNTTYAIKAASGVGVNNIVPVNVTIAGTPVPDGSGSGVRLPYLELSTPDPEPPVLPDTGVGDVFSFDGDDVRGWTRAQEGPVNLGDGDTLRFVNYDADTFVDDAAGTAEGGETAEIASRADLKAMIADSPDVTAQAWGSTLALRIAQDSGTHAVVLTDVGDAGYFL